MGDLTKDFSLHEFYVSASYPNLARVMVPTPSQAYKCFLLSRMILQPLRDVFQVPIQITRAVASEELNKAQGGVPTSDHLFLGNTGAVDWLTREKNNTELIRSMFRYLVSQCAGFIKPWGQLILECGSDNKALNLHASLPSERHMGEMLIRYADKTIVPFEGDLP